MFKLSLLKKLDKNPRKIGKKEMEALKKSISEFSKMLPLRPIIYDPVNMEVLGGNQRFEALIQLNYDEVPDNWVKSADDMTDEEKKRFIITDNVNVGTWDNELLHQNFDLESLKSWFLDVNFLEPKQPKEVDYKNNVDLFYINIKCENEKHAQELYERFILQGLDVKVIT